MERNRGRGRGTVLTAAGVLAALAVVALASRGGVSAGEAGSRRPSDGLLDALLSLLVVAVFAGTLAIVLFVLFNRDVLRGSEIVHRRRNSRRTILVVLVAVAALSLVVWQLGSEQNELELPQLAPPPAAGDAEGGARSEDAYDPQFAWLPVAVVCTLASAGILAAWWSARARRRARGEDGAASFAEVLDDVLTETLDDLRAETDPRRAVIAAYARLERALAAYGLPRKPAEAPLEYLARMLESAEVTPAAGRRLTVLFERARFSQHEVGAEMKDQAIAALETARDDLRAAELRAQQAREDALALARERAASL